MFGLVQPLQHQVIFLLGQEVTQPAAFMVMGGRKPTDFDDPPDFFLHETAVCVENGVYTVFVLGRKLGCLAKPATREANKAIL